MFTLSFSGSSAQGWISLYAKLEMQRQRAATRQWLPEPDLGLLYEVGVSNVSQLHADLQQDEAESSAKQWSTARTPRPGERMTIGVHFCWSLFSKLEKRQP